MNYEKLLNHYKLELSELDGQAKRLSEKIKEYKEILENKELDENDINYIKQKIQDCNEGIIDIISNHVNKKNTDNEQSTVISGSAEDKRKGFLGLF